MCYVTWEIIISNAVSPSYNIVNWLNISVCTSLISQLNSHTATIKRQKGFNICSIKISIGLWQLFLTSNTYSQECLSYHDNSLNFCWIPEDPPLSKFDIFFHSQSSLYIYILLKLNLGQGYSRFPLHVLFFNHRSAFIQRKLYSHPSLPKCDFSTRLS